MDPRKVLWVGVEKSTQRDFLETMLPFSVPSIPALLGPQGLSTDDMLRIMMPSAYPPAVTEPQRLESCNSANSSPTDPKKNTKAPLRWNPVRKLLFLKQVRPESPNRFDSGLTTGAW